MIAENKPVLVVDDEEIVRDSLTEWLKSEGYDAESAEDGKAALERIQEKDYKVVVLDMKMPGMDGLTVLKEVQKTRPDTKVIIITAYASVETAVQALKDGAVDYIVKPFDPEKVEESVAKWVGKPKITSGSAATETSAPDTTGETLASALLEARQLLDGGNAQEALATINRIIGEAGLAGVQAPPRIPAKVAPAPVPEKVELPAPAAKPKVGKYFPPHFWEGCFSYICGKKTCPFTADCFAAQSQHQRETEKFIDTINQKLLKKEALTGEEDAEVRHTMKYHGIQLDAKQGVYVVNKAALRNKSGLGGSYFR